jgi:saccharopine dehydrogenase (NAD+, L-lysine-forming)
MAETAHGGPFPEVLEHEIFLNCILATPASRSSCRRSAPPRPARSRDRRHRLRPDIDFSPVKVYDAVTDWAAPARASTRPRRST